MRTKKQKIASLRNIKSAQKKWKSMSKRQRTQAQPEGKDRAKPGSLGTGKFYRIEVRDKNKFTLFKNHDVGDKGGIERIAGHRPSGSWATQAWLIEKSRATFTNGSLKGKDTDVQDVIDQLGSQPIHIKGDIFKAKPRPNVPEKDKPTLAMKKAQKENIKKAQEARKKK